MPQRHMTSLCRCQLQVARIDNSSTLTVIIVWQFPTAESCWVSISKSKGQYHYFSLLAHGEAGFREPWNLVSHCVVHCVLALSPPCLPNCLPIFVSRFVQHCLPVCLSLVSHFSPTFLPLVSHLSFCFHAECWESKRPKHGHTWTLLGNPTREPLKLGFAKAGLIVFPLLGQYLFAGRHATAIECQLHRLLWLCMRPSHSKKTQFDLDFAIFCSYGYFTILVASRRQPPAPDC